MKYLFLFFFLQMGILFAQPPVSIERKTDPLPFLLGTRQRTAPQIMFFAESQLKYGMFQNYLHYWIDRPLFFDRSSRYPERRFSYMTEKSILIDVRQIRQYGLDGLGTFAMPPHKFRLLREYLETLSKNQVSGVKLLAQIYYGEPQVKYRLNCRDLAEMFRYCYTSDHVARIGNRLLFASYGSQRFSSEQHRQLIAELKKELQRDDFAILCDLPEKRLRPLQNAWKKKGSLDSGEQKQLEQLLEEHLQIFDGLQLRISMLERPPEGEYLSFYNLDFFSRYTAPLLEKIFARPEYRHKLLGFVLNQGYVNHFSGHNHGEYGTETLRRHLREALKLNPDYILFFEWNEANENTSFQPTVYNSFSTQRLLKYVIDLAHGKQPSPNPGDDVSLPNLVLSYRITAKFGEKLRFELLNIPDGVFTEPFRAKLILKDGNGRLLLSFPEESIDPKRLMAFTYAIPSEQWTKESGIVPELLINGKSRQGFSPLRFASTVCWNYKEVRQSLRDLIPDPQLELHAREIGDRTFEVEGRFSCTEPLASLELLDGENEILAVDSTQEFKADQNQTFRLAFTQPPDLKAQYLSGTIGVEKTSMVYMRPDVLANVNPGNWKREGKRLRGKFRIWSQENAFLINIPRNEITSAELSLQFEGMEPFRIGFQRVFENGLYSVVLDQNSALRAEIRRQDDLPDVPPHLMQKQARFLSAVRCSGRFPFFTLRAITAAGKIYRSRPIVPRIARGQLKILHCFSETSKSPTAIQVPEDLLPDIRFRFQPDAGAALLNSWSNSFDAQLGGGFYYMEAFSRSQKRIPHGNRAPEWIHEKDGWILRFDGRNDYLNFGRETLPNGAFTLDMEIKPDSCEQTMVLFRHFNYILGSISLFLRDGKLYATFGDKRVFNHKFDTALPVPSGKWSSITVSYDLHHLTFTVNRHVKRFPFSARAYSFKPAIFGGHTKNEFAPPGPLAFYKGDLRALRIRHYAVPIEKTVKQQETL